MMPSRASRHDATGRATRLVWLTIVAALIAVPVPLRAQTPDPDPGVTSVVSRLEAMLQSGSPDDLAALADGVSSDALRLFSDEFFTAGITRAVARERDRVPLDGSLPGDGYALALDFFSEIGDHARLMTARVDIRRPHDGPPESWRIVALERLSLAEGLHRLRIDTTVQYAAHELSVAAEDLRLTLHDGAAFRVVSDAGVTGLLLLGRGEMRFAPSPPTEQGQLRIIAGAATLVTPFDSAYVRMNPADYEQRVDSTGLTEVAPDPRMVRQAVAAFARESVKSYNIDLGDLSDQLWYILPPQGDFLAELRTRRLGTVTYTRTANQAEDIQLFNRERRKTYSLYASADRLASRGRSYDEDALTDYDVTSYDVDLAVDPAREYVEGLVRLSLRTRVAGLAVLTLRLADTLAVSNVTSAQFGRLLFLRVRNQNSLIVNLPTTLPLDATLTLSVAYAGRVPSQTIDGSEGVALAQQDGEDLPIVFEPKYLLSNRSYWYPQNAVSDFATARLRIVVPAGYTCVASGQVSAERDVPLRDLLNPMRQGRPVIFTASDPLRYLSIVVSRFTRVAETTVETGDGPTASPPAGPRLRPHPRIALAVDANPRLQSQGRTTAAWAADVLRFYSGLLGDAPYGGLTIAAVEDELPGGHSPAYAVMLNHPTPESRLSWRDDPAAFTNFPEFFVAHEVAHQWFGQAVAWENYHEQWLSEGFAQYFAALYAERAHGTAEMESMLRQFRRWSLTYSREGPVSLGYRLGHVKDNSRIFRALVYNKGAGVLHMLRRLVGDDAFFSGLRLFYREQKFRKAGTDDLRRAMESASGRSLERFFERWIHGDGIPRIRYNSTVTGDAVLVRFEQLGDELFDLPVTVSLTGDRGGVTSVTVPVTERVVERRITIAGPIRQVRVNRDGAALARFEEN